MPLCRNTKIRPHMYDVPNKGTIKYEIMPHLFAAKRGYGSEKHWADVIQWHLHKLEAACLRPITSALP